MSALSPEPGSSTHRASPSLAALGAASIGGRASCVEVPGANSPLGSPHACRAGPFSAFSQRTISKDGGMSVYSCSSLDSSSASAYYEPLLQHFLDDATQGATPPRTASKDGGMSVYTCSSLDLSSASANAYYEPLLQHLLYDAAQGAAAHSSQRSERSTVDVEDSQYAGNFVDDMLAAVLTFCEDAEDVEWSWEHGDKQPLSDSWRSIIGNRHEQRQVQQSRIRTQDRSESQNMNASLRPQQRIDADIETALELAIGCGSQERVTPSSGSEVYKNYRASPALCGQLQKMATTVDEVSNPLPRKCLDGELDLEPLVIPSVEPSNKPAKPSGPSRRRVVAARPRPSMGSCGIHDAKVAELAQSMMQQYDLDRDNHLSLEEARELFRGALGLHSKNRRNPAALNRAAFSAICDDPAHGLSFPELCELLDFGGALCAAGPLHVPPQQGAEPRKPSRPEAARDIDLRVDLDFGPKSHRDELRAALRSQPPRTGATTDAVDAVQVLRAVRGGDGAALSGLFRQGALWSCPNPRVLDLSLQRILGTGTARFPLLFVATFHGRISIWELLVHEIFRRGGQKALQEALSADVEGWLLPSVMCLAEAAPAPAVGPNAEQLHERDSDALLESYFSRAAAPGDFEGATLFFRCLFMPSASALALPVGGGLEDMSRVARHSHVAPLELLLQNEDWPRHLAHLLRCGGGFPHDESAESMSLVGSLLARRCCVDRFLSACRDGGDEPRAGTSAFAGLFLGLLDCRVPAYFGLRSLQTLVCHGLSVNSPLAHEHSGLSPLHAAARRDRAHTVGGLLALRADLHSTNGRGQTAMEAATIAQSRSAILVLRGASRRRPVWDEVVSNARDSVKTERGYPC